jgi:hypothetical protein
LFLDVPSLRRQGFLRQEGLGSVTTWFLWGCRSDYSSQIIAATRPATQDGLVQVGLALAVQGIASRQAAERSALLQVPRHGGGFADPGCPSIRKLRCSRLIFCPDQNSCTCRILALVTVYWPLRSRLCSHVLFRTLLLLLRSSIIPNLDESSVG